MADVPDLGDLLRRNVESGLRFYQGLVRLSADYLKEVSSAFAKPGVAGEEETPPAAPRAAALVLEAEAGREAQGFFLVENNTSRRVAADVVVSPLIDPDGHEIEQLLEFEPARVSLGSSEQTVVRVFGKIDPRLEAGVGYRGALTVPGVSRASAAIVVRRLHGVATAGQAAEVSPEKAPAGKVTAKRATRKRTTPKRPAARTTTAKKTAAKKTAAKKTAAKKTAAKKGAGRSASRTSKR